jgi:hypothetical protein
MGQLLPPSETLGVVAGSNSAGSVMFFPWRYRSRALAA